MIRGSTCFDTIIIVCSVMKLSHCVSLAETWSIKPDRVSLFLRVRDVMWLDIDDQCQNMF